MNEDLSTSVVSVVIVSWNAREYLLACLGSLTAAVSRHPLEIIVVDNGSTDGSPESVEARFPHVRLIRNHDNLGFARANNQGIAASSGRYVALVNSDVKVLDGCITQLADFCANHPRVGMVGPRIIGRDGATQRSCRGFPTLWNMTCRALALDTCFPRARAFSGYSLAYWAQDSCRPVDILTGCFWLVRREALAAVGLLDERFFMYGEDMDWCRRFWTAGWQVVFVPSAEAIHYGGASSANAPVRFFLEMYKADLQYWRKHHSRVRWACFRAILCVHMLLRALGYGWLEATRRSDRTHRRHKLERSVSCLRWLLHPGTP